MTFRAAIENRYGSEQAAVSKCAGYICCVCHDIKATKSEFNLEGLEESGVFKGNWKVTIERLPD